MQHRRFQFWFTILGLVLGGSFSFSAEKPSVLFLNVDDWNDWNEVLKGHSQAITPNIKRLAERGIVFSNAISASPSCFPSRTSLFTGIHPAKSGCIVNDNGMHPWRFYLPDEVTLPKHVSTHGWKSVGIAKNFHGGDKPEFDEYIQISKNVPVIKGSGIKLNSSGVWGVANIPTEKMPDYMAVSKGIQQIKKEKGPIFLSLGIYRPHVPWVVPQKYFDLYPLESLETSKYIDDDLKDLPERFKLLAHFESKFGKGYHQNLVKHGYDRDFIRAYLASVTFADEQLGRILDAWDESDHSKNGYIVFWSDHGYMLGEKEAWSKMKPWYDASRCNLIFSGPGIERGKVVDKAVSLLDIYPTLLNLINLPSPKQELEGNSLWPLLQNPTMKWDRPVVMSSEADGVRYDSVLSNNFRLTQLITGERELYDHKNDPNEFHNLADSPDYSSVIAELSNYLTFDYAEMGKGDWVEVESLPAQTSSDFKKRGNCHYPKLKLDASGGKVLGVDLRAGVDSYLDLVIEIKESGVYQFDITMESTGLCDVLFDHVVNDSAQADFNYPMVKLGQFEGKLKTKALNQVEINKPGLKILRFVSKTKKQALQIDALQVKKI